MASNNIALTRLTNQGIASPSFDTANAVVSWLGALQAQDYHGALWTIGLRMADATVHTVEDAIAQRTIVRTWPMRGTLHFVAAQDVRWLLKLLTPRIIAQAAGRYRQLGLDEATFARSKAVFAKTLQGGKQLTRAEMQQALERENIDPSGQRGYYILVRSAQDGLICFGMPRGKQQTFTLLDEWVPPTKELARDEALAALAQRYFSSHGPATLQDFMRWAGLTTADARLGVAAAQPGLHQETLDGHDYWFASTLAELANQGNSAFLLPGFDEYLLGYADRSAVLDPAYAQRVCPGGNGMFSPTIVVDGRVVGTWKRVLKKNQVVITPSPFTPLSQATSQALTIATQRYAAFVGLPAILA